MILHLIALAADNRLHLPILSAVLHPFDHLGTLQDHFVLFLALFWLYLRLILPLIEPCYTDATSNYPIGF